MLWVLKVLCTGAGEVQTLGDNLQTLEDEANADVADTLIDDALGKFLPCCSVFLHCTCPDVKIYRVSRLAAGCMCSNSIHHRSFLFRQQIVSSCLSLTPSNWKYICIHCHIVLLDV